MSNIINLSAKPNGKRTVTTEDLFTLVNEERTSLGESKVQYSHLLARVVDELSDDEKFHYKNFVVKVLSTEQCAKSHWILNPVHSAL